MDTFGERLKIRISGASHAPSLGVVIEGVPSGIPLSVGDFSYDMARRAPSVPGTTARREEDIPVLSGGISDGMTTGEPLAISFANRDARSADYDVFRDMPRPGHADRAARLKYGDEVDLRGGGKFSGRMTLPLVAAGVVAKKMLPEISFDASLTAVGGSNDSEQWSAMIEAAAKDGDSLGGIVTCTVTGVPAGVGEPFFDSVESLISHAVFSIPGVRGIEFGDGFAASAMRGSEHNDPWTADGPAKNGAGGINGGITNGAPIVFRVAFKPTSSIARPQETYNFTTRQMDTLLIGGRHDVCFALRTPVIVEAMAAIVLADLMM